MFGFLILRVVDRVSLTVPYIELRSVSRSVLGGVLWCDSPCSHGIFASGLATIHCIAIRSESVGRRFLRRTNGNVCASYV